MKKQGRWTKGKERKRKERGGKRKPGERMKRKRKGMVGKDNEEGTRVNQRGQNSKYTLAFAPSATICVET